MLRKNRISFLNGFGLFALLVICSFNAYAEKIRMGFLCPEPEDDPFWGPVVNVMRAAAKDLDVELIVNCSRRGSLATKRAGMSLLNTEPPLDYFITGYWPTVTKYHLELANERGIQTFAINANVREEDKADIGKPRGRFKNWIGHMVPDDRQAAVTLTNFLLKRAAEARKKSKSDGIKMLALIGNGASSIGRNRHDGMYSAVKAIPGAEVQDVVGEYWVSDWSRDATVKALQSSPGIDAIFGVNEAAAWGAVLGAEKAGRKPGKDIIIGGFDWNPDSLAAMADDRLSASMFGHFLEGAWALILSYDHYYGYDFDKDPGVQIATPFSVMTRDNYEQYRVILTKDYWDEVDFRKLSKKYNPELKRYNLSISQFLK